MRGEEVETGIDSFFEKIYCEVVSKEMERVAGGR